MKRLIKPALASPTNIDLGTEQQQGPNGIMNGMMKCVEQNGKIEVEILNG